MSLVLMYLQKKWEVVVASSMLATTIIYLHKSKEKDGKEIIGNIIGVKDSQVASK